MAQEAINADVESEKRSTPTDSELMRRLANGDMSALGQLVHAHQQHVRVLAFRICGRWDLADDITQEVFLRVYRSASSYQPQAAFSTWLYRIVVNLCLDERKRPRPAQLDPSDAPGTTHPVVTDPDRLVHAERAAAIQRAVAQLPERQRVAIVLHRFEALSHAEIASATGWSTSSVESLLVRAYAELRQALASWAP
jgi:RNA polymerase sigma-70 factor (ECF subfamily)